MPRLLLLNHVVLLFLCSILLGVGLAAWHWGYPMAGAGPMIDPGRILTILTVLMVAAAAAMLLTEWFTGMRLLAALVLLAAVGAALLTLIWIPDQAREAGGSEMLGYLFHARTALWGLAWAGTACWFARLADAARADR